MSAKNGLEVTQVNDCSIVAHRLRRCPNTEPAPTKHPCVTKVTFSARQNNRNAIFFCWWYAESFLYIMPQILLYTSDTLQFLLYNKLMQKIKT